MHYILRPCFSLCCIISHGKVWENPSLLSLNVYFVITRKCTHNRSLVYDNGYHIFWQAWDLNRLRWLVQFHKPCIPHFFAMWSNSCLSSNNKSLLTFGNA